MAKENIQWHVSAVAASNGGWQLAAAYQWRNGIKTANGMANGWRRRIKRICGGWLAGGTAASKRNQRLESSWRHAKAVMAAAAWRLMSIGENKWQYHLAAAA